MERRDGVVAIALIDARSHVTSMMMASVIYKDIDFLSLTLVNETKILLEGLVF
jgi:hypothetical protein